MPTREELIARVAGLSDEDLAALADLAPSTSTAKPPLELTSEPSPSNGDGEITRQQLDAWGELYGTQHRQLRRWIARGRERNDPCPLDRPAEMPGWWERNMSKPKVPPEKVLAAARQAQGAGKPSSPADSGQPQSSVPPPVNAVAPLDLANVGGTEGEAVIFCRKIVAAIQTQLQEAYLAGAESRIQSLHSRYERALESLRKQEKAAEAKAIKNGELLSKADVLNEVATALAALKTMRESMAKRVVAEVTSLAPEQAEAIRQAIEAVRAREDDILRNLSLYKTPADVLFALAA